MQLNQALFALTALLEVRLCFGKILIFINIYFQGYYYSYGSGASANKWIIFFQGGGWCYSVNGCYARSLTALGSSKSWPATSTNADGMMAGKKYCEQTS